MARLSDPGLRDDIASTLSSAVVLFVRHLGHGQSLTQNAVLGQLADDGPVRLTTLAAATGVSQPSMTQLIARLEREGLVARFNDPDDGRATLVQITDDGRAYRVATRRALRERLNCLLDTLPPDDEATLALAMRVAAPLIEQLSHQARVRPALPAPT